jgi:hypothetical protein
MIDIGSLVECIKDEWVNFGTGQVDSPGPRKGDVEEVIGIYEHPILGGAYLEFAKWSPQRYDINFFRELDVPPPGEVEELVEESCCVPIELFVNNGR